MNRFNLDYISVKLPLIILSLGIMFRLTQYLYNRSLWLDELFLALNIIDFPFSDLKLQLDQGQAAPIGFLYLQKLIIKIFNTSEYSLRVLPLISGIFSQILIFKVAKKVLSQKGLIFVLLIFAISDSLIYYSSELKQYSSDVLITLILYYYIYLSKESLKTVKNILLVSFLGSLIIWFSHPSIFILAGIASSWLYSYLIKKKRSLIEISFPLIFWFLSFLFNYSISLSELTSNTYLLKYWESGFIPFNFYNVFGLKVLITNLKEFIEIFIGLSPFFLLFPFLLTGIYSMNKRKPYFCISILLPCFYVILASILHKYPFKERLILFLFPSFSIFIAEGIDFISSFKLNYYAKYIFYIILICIFFPSISSAFIHVFKPRIKEESKKVFEYIKINQKPGDIVYLHHRARWSYYYYSKHSKILNYKFGFKLPVFEGIKSPNDPSKYIDDLQFHLKNKKSCWIVFSSSYQDEVKLILNYLNNSAKLVDSFKLGDSQTYKFLL